MKTNLFKSVEMNLTDTQKVEKEISSLLEIGTSIAIFKLKHFNLMLI